MLAALEIRDHPECLNPPPPAPMRKLLAANRSEIAIRIFRSATELGIRTVAIYSHEDRFALHRFKADEAYRIGKPGEPIRAYLDIEGIVRLAQAHEVEAIHPGYGFLSENPHFARACRAAGLGNFRRDCFGLVLIQINDEDTCAVRGEGIGNGAADSAGASGDDSGFAFQPEGAVTMC